MATRKDGVVCINRETKGRKKNQKAVISDNFRWRHCERNIKIVVIVNRAIDRRVKTTSKDQERESFQ
jgi:hypothetical protein